MMKIETGWGALLPPTLSTTRRISPFWSSTKHGGNPPDWTGLPQCVLLRETPPWPQGRGRPWFSNAGAFPREATAGVSRRLFALGLGPLDHVDMPAVDALKQQDRGESVVEPGQLPGQLHARPALTTDQPRLWLVVHA